MKKLLTTSAILLATTVLVACSNNQSTTKDSSEQPKTEQTKANDKPASKKATSLDDFKKALESNGFTIKDEIKKSASLIQAESGKAFVLEDDSQVEVYDKNPMFEEAKKEKELIGHPAYIYGNYVVLVLNATDSKDKILESFKGFE